MKIEIYTKKYCLYCRRAKELLLKKHLFFHEIVVDDDIKRYDEMLKRCGGTKTVPQIFFNGKCIGGSDDLYLLDSEGKLDDFLIDCGQK